MSTDTNHTIEKKICFICATQTCESFISLNDSVSKASNTPIHSLVYKLLDNKPSVRDVSSDVDNTKTRFLCVECLDKLNQYDIACTDAIRLEEELRFELFHTEAFYQRCQNVQDFNEFISMDVSEEANSSENIPGDNEQINIIDLCDENDDIDDDDSDVVFVDQLDHQD